MDQSKGFMYGLILLGVGAIVLLFMLKYMSFKEEPSKTSGSPSEKEAPLPKK